MLKIIIYLNKNNIINGTLFYCVEHLLYTLKYKDCELLILGDDINIDYIRSMMLEKYKMFDISKIKHISRTKLLKSKINKALILDELTYNKLNPFFNNIGKILLYSNEKITKKYRSQDIVYGFYNYQHKIVKERLKIGFEFMKIPEQKINKTFCSFPINTAINKNNIIGKYDIIFKNFNKFYNILEFKEIIYFHSKGIDKNNRIIPECFYFNIPIVLINNETTNDSVNERYTECLANNCLNLTINKDYKLLKDFIE